MGAGVTGDLGEDLHYRACVLNGLDGDTFSAVAGIAPARGQGAFAHANEAAGALRATWTGVLGAEIGVGGYYGGAAADVKELEGVAVGIAEVDARVERAGLWLRAEAVDVEIVNAQKVVAFQQAADPTVEAIGAAARGGYVEAGYDVLHLVHAAQELVPFARFEALDLKARLAPGDGNLGTPAGHRPRRYLFTGLVWKPERRIALKADYRFALKEPAEVEPTVAPAGAEGEEAEEAVPHGNTLSLGIGVMF